MVISKNKGRQIITDCDLVLRQISSILKSSYMSNKLSSLFTQNQKQIFDFPCLMAFGNGFK